MRVYKDESISSFDFWCGARDTVKHLTDDEMDTIEIILDDLYPEGMEETTLNDLFRFEDDLIAEWLGYDSFDEIMNREEEIK